MSDPITLTEALAEMVAAFTASPDTDERDHPGGLTPAQVEEAWERLDLRQNAAIDKARVALSTTSAPDPLSRCPWCGHPPMCHKGPEGECVVEAPHE